ncbi:MAG: hypothetical protein K6U89_19715 [Chloroflexi bacterium]|jgi:hypothetical protein|nr:hypothetical protein [Chloroflexota bacterium]
MKKGNPYEYRNETAERQGGGNTPVSGEKHAQKKGERIRGEQRYDGAGDADLQNSPGRASVDISRGGR